MISSHIGSEDPFLDELDSQLKGLTPTYQKWRVVRTLFSEPVLVKDYAHLLCEKLNYSYSVKRNFDEQEVVEYFTTLLAIRISYVNGDKFIDVDHKLNRYDYNESVTVPDIINVLLNQVGRVVDQELGFEILPAMGQASLLEPSRFNALSTELRDIRAAGVAYSMVLPRDRQGDPLFMSLQMANDAVVGSDPKVHPSQVFLGAFFKSMQESAVLEPLLVFAQTPSLRRIVGNVIK